jgi:hypothetical protein
MPGWKRRSAIRRVRLRHAAGRSSTCGPAADRSSTCGPCHFAGRVLGVGVGVALELPADKFTATATFVPSSGFPTLSVVTNSTSVKPPTARRHDE